MIGQIRTIILLCGILATSASHASFKDLIKSMNQQSAAHTGSRAQRLQKIVEIAREVHVDGKRLKNPLAFAREVQALELMSHRKTSDSYIRQMAELEIQMQAPGRACFTPSMRVLTPSGYVAIEKLAAGDEVISWDVEADKPVVNQIVRKTVSEDEEYLRLCPVQPRGQALEVTAEHPFYAPAHGLYIPLSEIKPSERLLRIRGDLETSACESHLVKRGAVTVAGRGVVMSLSLELEPNNFIVEEILVHNK